MRVPYGTRVDALRTAQPRANKVEVVNAVIEDFEPGCGSKKGPEMPWSISACLDFDVVDFTKEATACQCGDSEVIGRVAQREVYCGGETLAPAKVANDASFLEGLTHGLLHEYGRAIGYMRKDVHKLRGGNPPIQEGVTPIQEHRFLHPDPRTSDKPTGAHT